MVSLSKIYTKSGDKGKTSLGNGQRVHKSSLRISAIGEVDEVNSTIGLVRLYTTGEIDDIFAHIQNDLFDLGADLCIPDKDPEKLSIALSHISYLEKILDHYNEDLEPLKSFVLPGGSKESAYLHHARTVTRRAERSLSELMVDESVNPYALQYLNRLSDLLFVMARYMNDKGRKDVLWEPGKTLKEQT